MFKQNKSSFTEIQFDKNRYNHENKEDHNNAERKRINENKIRKLKIIEFLTTTSPDSLLEEIAEQHIYADDTYADYTNDDNARVYFFNNYQYHKDTRNWLTQIYLHLKQYPNKKIEHDLLELPDQELLKFYKHINNVSTEIKREECDDSYNEESEDDISTDIKLNECDDSYSEDEK